MTEQKDEVFRPIIGIENRTAQEVFDIMCDRHRLANTPAPNAGLVEEALSLIRDIAGEFPWIEEDRFQDRARAIVAAFRAASDGTTGMGARGGSDEHFLP